jgi:hypothetical protein
VPDSSEWSLHFKLSEKSLYSFRVFAMNAPNPAHLILLTLIFFILHGEKYKLRSSSSCSFLQSSIMPPFYIKILLPPPSVYVSPCCEGSDFAPKRRRSKIVVRLQESAQFCATDEKTSVSGNHFKNLICS